ncbi:MAG: endonuclease/exonuclease/phosphatase family protein [Chloroflexota bacterium]
MPSYRDLQAETVEGRRVLERLLVLREQLSRDIPARTFEQTLLLATWNIREFDAPAYGERLEEAYYYIAEIIARFDLVAIQEVRRDLKALDRVCDLLGPNWAHIVTDVTEGQRGNDERMAFLYDTRKVQFGGLAGQLVLPPLEVKGPDGKTAYVPVSQLARTPFFGGFVSGWTRFILATVHILYGADASNNPERLNEIRQIAHYLRNRTLDEKNWARNLLLLGDFNICAPEDQTMRALKEEGFYIPPELEKLPSNAPCTKHYDQIAFRVRQGSLDKTDRAGVFNYYESIFRLDDEQLYVPYMGDAYHFSNGNQPRKDKTAYYRDYWRTHQMSDHLPMWVELQIDYSDQYLRDKLSGAQP